MNFIRALLFAAVALTSPSTVRGIDSCGSDCLSQAASNAGCSSFFDIECTCESSSFQTDTASCVDSNCSSDTAEDVKDFVANQCEIVTGGFPGASEASSVLSSLSSAASSFNSGFTSSIGSAFSTFTATSGQTGTPFAAATSSPASSAAFDRTSYVPSALISVAFAFLGSALGFFVS